MGWRPHVQSYFIVFKKNVFLSKVFDDFIKSIKEEKTKRGVISNYEIGLSEHLKQAGYKYSTLINAYPYINNIAIWKWYQIILKHKMPFLKCSMPRLKNKNFVTAAGYEDVINSVSDYPIELIYNNIRRFGIEPKKYSKRFIILKRIVFKFVPYIPDFLRHIIRVTVGQFLKFIKD
jgi:lipopolysaccharide biosynthesis protein